MKVRGNATYMCVQVNLEILDPIVNQVSSDIGCKKVIEYSAVTL